MTVFDRAFAVVIDHEGGYTNDDRDAGNWTGGRCGVGECRGTKYGISSATYPYLDIAALTLDNARDVYLADFWRPIRGDALPPQIALLLFDTAVNSGVATAVRWLQTCIGCVSDGVLGPGTQAALKSAIAKDGIDTVCADFLAFRIVALARLAVWPTYGHGWAVRICRLAYQSTGMEKQP